MVSRNTRITGFEFGRFSDFVGSETVRFTFVSLQKVSALPFERKGRLFYIPTRMGRSTLTFKDLRRNSFPFGDPNRSFLL
jgi:hypothetical protein